MSMVRATTGKRLRGIAAFSLIEWIIVIVLLAIIGAITLPRMSRGSASVADAALVEALASLRGALELYSTEHGGAYPTAAKVTAALTTYTDDAGNTNGSKTFVYLYGPYLRKLPPLPVGARRGATRISDVDAAGAGWIYNASTGRITANCSDSETDGRGVKFKEY